MILESLKEINAIAQERRQIEEDLEDDPITMARFEAEENSKPLWASRNLQIIAGLSLAVLCFGLISRSNPTQSSIAPAAVPQQSQVSPDSGIKTAATPLFQEVETPIVKTVSAKESRRQIVGAINPVAEPARKARGFQASMPDFRCEAIFLDSNSSLCIINGEVLGVGEKLQGAEITAIHSDNVEINWQGQVKNLYLQSRANHQ